MKNKDTKWLKDGLKWYAEKGYKLEEDMDNYWQGVNILGKMVKGAKIVFGTSLATGMGAILSFASTDDFNTKFHTGVDLFKEKPEWFIFGCAAIAVAYLAGFGAKKFEELREKAFTNLEKTQTSIGKVQEKANAFKNELHDRGIRPKFRTVFRTQPIGLEEQEDEEVPLQPAQIKDETEQTGEYLDTMASQGIRPGNRHGRSPEYSRESYREKYFPTKQSDASLDGQSSAGSSVSQGRDVQDLVAEIFKNNPTNQGPSQQ